MFDKKYIIPADALKLILDAVPGVLSSESIRIEECLGRITASDIYSIEDLPGFARSAVDGYAVKASDTYGARETLPAYIKVKDEVFMGLQPLFEVGAGEAARIPTGGMMPSGTDAVIMIEHAQIVSDSEIEVLRPAAFGENVIQPDEDIKKGAIVLGRGQKLRPQDLGALAGLGILEAEVVRKPLVSIISTGDEIVPHGSSVEPGQVRDINSFTLAGLISEEGGLAVKKGIFRDGFDTIKRALDSAAADSDIVLIIGGTSVGVRDMTADIINDSGYGGVLFHGVALKPGKPLIAGIVNDRPVFGLPGHPAAVVICFDTFVRPIISKMLGIDNSRTFRRFLNARMSKGVASAAGRQDHVRVHIETEDSGGYTAVPVMGKSGLITTLVRADGVVVIPRNKLGLDAGEDVTVNLF